MSVRIENQAEPLPGYRLIERLGGGGFGEVWKCEAPGGLFKAIKFVYGDLLASNDNAQRAEQELKALSRVKTVRHPYILSLERYDIIDGQLLIVMELADKNLWDRYKECRAQGLPGIPREELLGYIEETAEALDLMNQQYQLQHLDIKPQNLFLVHQHIKVADFGLVKDLEGTQASVTGGVTPVYAAPEAFDGKVSRYSDQYSLAIVYQEMLTGQRPFSGSNVRQLILQHLQGVPNVAPLPAADRPTIQRALAKDPSERFPSCSELIQALKAGGRSQESGRSIPGPDSSLTPAAPAGGAVLHPLACRLEGTRGSSWLGVTPISGPPTASLRPLQAETPSGQRAPLTTSGPLIPRCFGLENVAPGYLPRRWPATGPFSLPCWSAWDNLGWPSSSGSATTCTPRPPLWRCCPTSASSCWTPTPTPCATPPAHRLVRPRGAPAFRQGGPRPCPPARSC
jgi:serine/threonine protein kinase